MNALEFNNKIANLITKFITNIPTIGQFDPIFRNSILHLPTGSKIII